MSVEILTWARQVEILDSGPASSAERRCRNSQHSKNCVSLSPRVEKLKDDVGTVSIEKLKDDVGTVSIVKTVSLSPLVSKN